MPGREGADTPIWAAAKAKQQINILREVANALAQTERELASRPVAKLTESELAAEQLRLEGLLELGTIPVEDFRRLQEIDYYLDAMRHRREQAPRREGWQRESLTE